MISAKCELILPGDWCERCSVLLMWMVDRLENGLFQLGKPYQFLCWHYFKLRHCFDKPLVSRGPTQYDLIYEIKISMEIWPYLGGLQRGRTLILFLNEMMLICWWILDRWCYFFRDSLSLSLLVWLWRGHQTAVWLLNTKNIFYMIGAALFDPLIALVAGGLLWKLKYSSRWSYRS